MNQIGQVLQTVSQVAESPRYPFTEPSLRHLIFQAKDQLSANGDVIPGNGIDRAIIRVGRKVLIDLDAFDAWLEDHRETQNAGGC